MKTVWIVWLWLCYLLFTGVSSHAEVVDKIVAILGDDVILLSEVQEFAAAPVVRILANLEAADNTERGALHYLLERQLLQREIQTLAISQDTDFLKAIALQYLSTTYHQHHRDVLVEKLRVQNIPESALDQELLTYLKGVDYIRRKYRFREDITDPEIILTRFREWIADLQAQADIHFLL